jgi:hemolysin III
MTAVRPVHPHRSIEVGRPVHNDAAPRDRRALNARFGPADGSDVALGDVQRPTWRGGVHVVGLVAALPAVLVMLVLSPVDAGFRVALGVYAVGLCSMLGASATYHRWVHGLRARCAWRRVDHAAIFLAIAGSSTPIVVASLPGPTGLGLIGTVWMAALLGASFKLSRWGGGDRAGTAMYGVTIVLGSVAVPWLWTRHGVVPAALVVAGGVVYLLGAAGFAKRWPTLRPAVFSYHEVWHVFTVVAATTQFAAIWMLST